MSTLSFLGDVTPYKPQRIKPKAGQEGVLQFSHVRPHKAQDMEFIYAGNAQYPGAVHILLHGGNVDFEHAIPSAAKILELRPHDLTILLNAPHPFHDANGDKTRRSWGPAGEGFNIPSQELNESHHGIAHDFTQAVGGLKSLISLLSAHYNLPMKRFTLTAFSQGVGVGHYLCSQQLLGAFVGQSGPLPGDVSYKGVDLTPQLLIAGGKDWCEPFMQFKASAQRLKEAYNHSSGVFEFIFYPDMEHTTTPETRLLAARFIDTALETQQHLHI